MQLHLRWLACNQICNEITRSLNYCQYKLTHIFMHIKWAANRRTRQKRPQTKRLRLQCTCPASTSSSISIRYQRQCRYPISSTRIRDESRAPLFIAVGYWCCSICVCGHCDNKPLYHDIFNMHNWLSIWTLLIAISLLLRSAFHFAFVSIAVCVYGCVCVCASFFSYKILFFYSVFDFVFGFFRSANTHNTQKM